MRRSASSTTSTALPRSFNYAAQNGGSRAFGSSFGGDSVDLGDIFMFIFGSGFRRQLGPGSPSPTPPASRDIQVRITLSFDKAVHGCKKNITITPSAGVHSATAAAALPAPAPETCTKLRRQGLRHPSQRTPFGVMQTLQPYSRCGGKGQIVRTPAKELPRQRQDRSKEDAGGVHPARHRRRSGALHCGAWATPVPTAALPVTSS